MTTEQSITLIIEAFVVGLAAPLIVQLFLTLRSVQRTIAATRVRIERTLDSVDGAVAKLQAPSATNQALSAVGAALLPAAGAAFQAWREASARAHADAPVSVAGGADPATAPTSAT